MKNLFFASFFSLLAVASFAQDYTVNWGPEYKKDGGLFSSFYMAGMTGDHYHLIMRPRKDKTLLSFNTEHRLVKNQDVGFEVDGYDLDFDQFIETTAGAFALFDAHQRRNDEWQVYVSKFEDNKLDDLRKVYAHSFDGPRFVGYNFKPYFLNNLEISHNRNRVSFVNTLDLREKQDNAQFAVAVFDENMNLVWDKIQQVNYPDKDFRLEQTLVDDDGTVYALARLFEHVPTVSISVLGIGGNDGIPKFDYKVFKITQETIEEFDVELPRDFHAADAGIFLPKDELGTFLVGGFYTSDEKRSGLNGLFLTRSNTTNSELNTSTHQLERQFLEGLISNRDLRKDRGLNSSFEIDNLLLFADGSFAFIAEEYYITTSYSTNGTGTAQTTTNYHTDQIVIPRFDKDGQLLNIEKIDKSFESESEGSTSYSLALANGKIYLLYNDHKNRIERKNLRGQTKGGYYTDMTVIDDQGKIEFQETIFSSKDEKLIFLPSQSAYYNDKLIILGVSGFGYKRYKCGTIDLN